MPRFALVEFQTMAVVNVINQASNATPPAPPGFQWINESNWATTAAVGQIWDGQIPASFSDPVPEAPPEVPTDLEQVKAKLAALTTEIANVQAGIEFIQGAGG